jgi:hypothetical protein
LTAKLTAGKRLVKGIAKALPHGWEFDESDRLILASIEAAEDRRAALTALFEAEVAKPNASAHKAAALASEVRQIEQQLAKWEAALLAQTEELTSKSKQHQEAALVRWNRRSHRRGA